MSAYLDINVGYRISHDTEICYKSVKLNAGEGSDKIKESFKNILGHNVFLFGNGKYISQQIPFTNIIKYTWFAYSIEHVLNKNLEGYKLQEDRYKCVKRHFLIIPELFSKIYTEEVLELLNNDTVTDFTVFVNEGCACHRGDENTELDTAIMIGDQRTKYVEINLYLNKIGIYSWNEETTEDGEFDEDFPISDIDGAVSMIRKCLKEYVYKNEK